MHIAYITVPVAVKESKKCSDSFISHIVNYCPIRDRVTRALTSDVSVAKLCSCFHGPLFGVLISQFLVL